MSLPDDYLTYANRAHGQDIGRYSMRFSTDREKKTLPDGAALGVAIVVPLEYFMLNPVGKPFKHPGAMATPYPDLRHFTTRDYGNRVGAFRLLRALKSSGATATFAVNASLLERVRPLIDAVVTDGHEIAAHGLHTDAIHWGEIEPGEEERYVAETRAAFDKAGLSPRTWMSPARQQSFHTLDVIAKAGFNICLDWEQDTIPVPMTTDSGPVTAFPLLNELDDRFILTTKNHSEEEWCAQILEAADMMVDEAPRYGSQLFGFTMTPYICGLPFRMWAVRNILDSLSSRDEVILDSVSNLTDGLT